jgi:hypothetical protein
VGLAVTVLQLLLTEVRLKLYSLRHNASLYTRTWYYPSETVWKIGMGPEKGFRRRPRCV